MHNGDNALRRKEKSCSVEGMTKKGTCAGEDSELLWNVDAEACLNEIAQTAPLACRENNPPAMIMGRMHTTLRDALITSPHMNLHIPPSSVKANRTRGVGRKHEEYRQALAGTSAGRE